MKKEKVTLESLTADLCDRFERWQKLYLDGGQDPFWEDGVNLDLVRNHILYSKRNIKDYCEEKGIQLPDEYFFPTPDEVPRKYMAKADEILEKTSVMKIIIENSEEIKELRGLVALIKDKSLNNSAAALLNRVTVQNDSSLVKLRGKLWNFADALKEIEEKLPEFRNAAAQSLANGDYPQLSLVDIEREEFYDEEEFDDECEV